jgi:hypothetical protein
MWGLAFVWLLLRDKLGWALAAIFILILTRPNNIGAAALILTYLVQNRKRPYNTRLAPLFCAVGSFLLFFYFFYVLTFKGYNGTYLLPSILNFKLEKLLQILFQEDFGIVWSQTIWFLGFGLWVLFFVKGTDIFASAGVWLLASAALTVLWPTHGSTFGYRYLIGSYPALLILWLECLSSLAKERGSKFFQLVKVALVFLAVWSLLECWIYPAPAPYWSWTKPAHFKTGIPYGEFFSWIKMAPDLIKMNRFSEIGQFFEKLNLTVSSDFLDRGAVNQYALEGGVGNLNFIITLWVILFMAFNVYRLINAKKVARDNTKKRKRLKKSSN